MPKLRADHSIDSEAPQAAWGARNPDPFETAFGLRPLRSESAVGLFFEGWPATVGRAREQNCCEGGAQMKSVMNRVHSYRR